MRTRYNRLVLVLGLPLVGSLITFIVGVLRNIDKPYEFVLGEGFLRYQAYLIASGEVLFRPLTSESFYIVPHTPLFVTLCGGLSLILGDSLLVGRLVSLLCGFGICFLVYLITKKLTGDPLVSLLAGGLVATTFVFRFLVPLYRMDTMGVLLGLVGMYLVLRFEDRGKLIYWSVPVFVLAFFTKQSFFVAPIAVCAYLWIRAGWRIGPTLQYGLVAILTLGIGLLIGSLATGGELLVQNILYLVSGIEFTSYAYLLHMKSLLLFHSPLLLGILAYFICKIKRGDSWNVIDFFFLATIGYVLLTIGKVGGSFHYGFEFVSVGCILVGCLISEVFGPLKSSIIKSKQLGMVAFLSIVICVQVLGVPVGKGFFSYEYRPAIETGMKQLTDIIQSTPGQVFTGRGATPMALANEVDEWNPWEPALLFVGGVYLREDRFGWDQSNLVNSLGKGDYSLAIFEYDLVRTWSPDLEDKGHWGSRNKLSPEIASILLDNFSFKDKTSRVGTNQQSYRYYIYEYNGGSN